MKNLKKVKMTQMMVLSALKSITFCRQCSMFYSRQGAIPKEWILLDSQSTVDAFSNEKLLTNICDAKQISILFCNTDRCLLLRTVWFHPGGIANILFLNKMQQKHKVTYEDLSQEFVVHKADGTTRNFRPAIKGYS